MSSDSSDIGGEGSKSQSAVEVAKPEDTAEEVAADTPADAGASAPKKGGAGKVVLFLIVLFLLLGAAFGGWYFAQQNFDKQRSETAQMVEGNISELRDIVSSLETRLVQQAEQQDRFGTALVAASSDTEAQMLSLAERLAQIETTGSGDWELAEAEYLLRIANQRLVTSQDIQGAIEMMVAADNIFKALAYPELNQARRQLVADITRLGLIEPIDYEGIYFALDALLPEIASVVNTKIERLNESDKELTEDASVWEKTLNALRPYIVIESGIETEPEYIKSETQIAAAKSTIYLKVRQAQLALLSGDYEIYRAALEESAILLQETFSGAEKASALVGTLEDYAGRSLSSETADISASIREVEKVVDALTRLDVLGVPPDESPTDSVDQ